VERRFRVVGILLRGESIILELQPLRAQRATFIPESEEERIAFKIMDGFVKAMKQMSLQGLMPYGVGEPPRFEIALTREEYELMGSPTLNRVITVEFNIKIEE